MTIISEIRESLLRKSILLLAGLCGVVVTMGYALLALRDPDVGGTDLAVLEGFAVFLSTMYNVTIFLTSHPKFLRLQAEAKTNFGSVPIFFNAMLGIALIGLRGYALATGASITAHTIVGIFFGIALLVSAVVKWKTWPNNQVHPSSFGTPNEQSDL